MVRHLPDEVRVGVVVGKAHGRYAEIYHFVEGEAESHDSCVGIVKPEMVEWTVTSAAGAWGCDCAGQVTKTPAEQDVNPLGVGYFVESCQGCSGEVVGVGAAKGDYQVAPVLDVGFYPHHLGVEYDVLTTGS